MTKELTPNEQKLFAKYSANDIYAVNIEKYNYQLQKACAATSQEWSGSHGLRHNYAQNRMSELTDLARKTPYVLWRCATYNLSRDGASSYGNYRKIFKDK